MKEYVVVPPNLLERTDELGAGALASGQDDVAAGTGDNNRIRLRVIVVG